nr:MAG TPA: hypothetical protein [Caudoviricetes sp.]
MLQFLAHLTGVFRQLVIKILLFICVVQKLRLRISKLIMPKPKYF